MGIRLESCIFIGKTHDPAVSMGSAYRHVKHLAGQYVGCTDTAADHGRAGAVNTGVRSLGSSEAEFHDSVPAGGVYNSGSLRGDQRLVVNHIQNCRLQELGFHDGGNDLDDRLPGKDNRALGNSINIAGEMKSSQIFQKIILKQMKAPEDVYKRQGLWTGSSIWGRS